MDHTQVLEAMKKESDYYFQNPTTTDVDYSQKKIDSLIDNYINKTAVFTKDTRLSILDNNNNESRIMIQDIIMEGTHKNSNPSGIKYQVITQEQANKYEITEKDLFQQIHNYTSNKNKLNLSVSTNICSKCKEIIVDKVNYSVFKSDWFELRIGTDCDCHGSNYKLYEIDLCQDCTEQAIKILNENGFNINPKEVY